MTDKKKSNTVLMIALAVIVLGAAGYGYMKYSTPSAGPGASAEDRAAVFNSLLAKAKKAEQGGDPDQALEYYQEYLTVTAQPEDIKNPAVGAVHASMGNIYYKKFKYAKAIEHFKQGLDHALLYVGKQSREAGERWLSLAAIYDKQGDVKIALDHYKNSRAIQAKLGDDTEPTDKVILELEDYMVNANLQSSSSS